ncbi:Uu.00g110630.m01.CDS01 [Anthostomella pinea]|uniref:Chromosome segregation in meiosis protein n=1 Tax=Anthostomella pinea TaxID=933095 RepID=A0AAI8VFX0_9PEZI|nr:Uu.00g110630.m01.CDS01 [Anthostomella pinea]
MAPSTAAKKTSLPSRALSNAIDEYDVDDDPFASENDEAPNNGKANANSNAQSKKRKDDSGLGIDEEVAVAKKPRVPNVKLDESRLLSEKGIPRLRRKARDLKFKGKGHEFSDTARLLSFYQLWLDDLFPKAKFLDAVAMAEKMGHKKYMRIKRLEWIDEGKPKPAVHADQDDLFGEANQTEERELARFPARVAPLFAARASQRPMTPAGDDPFADEDIYDATPRRPTTTRPATNSMFGNGGSAEHGGEPDEDDLDALMAEEEAQRTAPKPFLGNGTTSRLRDEPDEDDLDALMAEAEAERQQPQLPKQTSKPNASKQAQPTHEDYDDDLDALMAEEEAQRTAPAGQLSGGGERSQQPRDEPDEDDLDALMAKAEADVQPKQVTKKAPEPARPAVEDYDDDLDALMAEEEAQRTGQN